MWHLITLNTIVHEQVCYLHVRGGFIFLCCGCECRSQLSVSSVHQYNICTVLDYWFKTSNRTVTVTLRLHDGFDAVCLMTAEILFSILCWLSMQTCYLSLDCNGSHFIIFSCGLKASSDTFHFLPKKQSGKKMAKWRRGTKYHGFNPKSSYMSSKAPVSQILLPMSNTGYVSKSCHVTLIWNIIRVAHNPL